MMIKNESNFGNLKMFFLIFMTLCINHGSALSKKGEYINCLFVKLIA